MVAASCSKFYAVLFTTLVPPRVSADVLQRVAVRLDVRWRYLLDAAEAAVVATRAAHVDYDFAENSSIFRRRQIQSEYWAPAVLCRQLSCPCGSCSGGSMIGPVFSEGIGENGVELEEASARDARTDPLSRLKMGANSYEMGAKSPKIFAPAAR